MKKDFLFKKLNNSNVEYSVEDLNDPDGAKKYFNSYGYLVVKNIIDSEELYCPVPKERGIITYIGNTYTHGDSDNQVEGCLARYSYPPYKESHYKVKKILEDILNDQLYPTYYFDRYYFSNQELTKHTDRDACEVSITIQVSTNKKTPWPICFETPDGKEVSVSLENGWGVVYKGCERPHWRNKLVSKKGILGNILNIFKMDNTYHHQIFYHYVRANGLRSHHAFDIK